MISGKVFDPESGTLLGPDELGAADPFATRCVTLASFFEESGALPRSGGVLDQPYDLMIGIQFSLGAFAKRRELEANRKSKQKGK